MEVNLKKCECCDGSGEVPCWNCDGMGGCNQCYNTGIFNTGTDFWPCFECNGTGKCPVCDGGEIIFYCEECQGTGVVQ